MKIKSKSKGVHFLVCCYVGASLIGNILAGKGFIEACEGTRTEKGQEIISAEKDF